MSILSRNNILDISEKIYIPL